MQKIVIAFLTQGRKKIKVKEIGEDKATIIFNKLLR